MATDLLRVTADPASSDWQLGASVEAGVFLRSGYVDTEAELAAEYAPYRPHSEFVVVQRDGAVEGGVRIIHFDPAKGRGSFKTLSDIDSGRLAVDAAGRQALENIEWDRTFEVGTLAVNEERRSSAADEGRVAFSLYVAIYGEYVLHDSPNAIASFDADFLDRFRAFCGPSVRSLGPATDYMGGPTVPVLMHIPTLFEYLLETFSQAYEPACRLAELLVHD